MQARMGSRNVKALQRDCMHFTRQFKINSGCCLHVAHQLKLQHDSIILSVRTKRDLYSSFSTALAHLGTFLAVPFTLGSVFRCQAHALKMEPFYCTVLIVTGNHLAKGNALTVAIDWLTRVHSSWNATCHACKYTQDQSWAIVIG